MKDLRVALVPVAGANYDLELAAQVTRTFRSRLIMRGLRVAGNIPLVAGLESAQAAIRQLENEAYDLLLVFQAAFAGSETVVHLAETIDRPVFLWAVPEAPSGGSLRLNSLSGASHAAHALTIRNIEYSAVYAAPDDLDAVKKLRAYAAAARVFQQLKSARLGIFGGPPPAQASLPDEPKLDARLGIQVLRLNTGQVFERVRQVEPPAAERAMGLLSGRVSNLDELDPAQIHRTLSAYLVLKDVVKEERLDALALHCRPEALTGLEGSICGALPFLSEELIACSGEANANSAAAQLILQGLSGEPAFEAGIVSADFEQDTLLLWHGGRAPLSTADRTFPPRASGGVDRHQSLSLEFPLKPGRVTMAGLSRASGELRLVVATGQMLAVPPDWSGTPGVVRFDRPARQALDTVLGQGLEPQFSLTYGEHLESILALAKLLHLPVLQL